MNQKAWSNEYLNHWQPIFWFLEQFLNSWLRLFMYFFFIQDTSPQLYMNQSCKCASCCLQGGELVDEGAAQPVPAQDCQERRQLRSWKWYNWDSWIYIYFSLVILEFLPYCSLCIYLYLFSLSLNSFPREYK